MNPRHRAETEAEGEQEAPKVTVLGRVQGGIEPSLGLQGRG